MSGEETSLRIEVAEPRDFDSVVRIVNDPYRGSSKAPGWTHEIALLEGQRVDASALAAMIEQDGATILVTKNGSDIVGCVALKQLNASEWCDRALPVSRLLSGHAAARRSRIGHAEKGSWTPGPARLAAVIHQRVPRGTSSAPRYRIVHRGERDTYRRLLLSV
jgi:hypothetical protein